MEPPAPAQRLALTVGDPAGIGPEICLRAATGTDLLLVGDACVLEEAARRAGHPMRLSICTLDALASGRPPGAAEGTVHLLDTGALTAPVPLGMPSAEGGRASFAAIGLAIEGARRGLIDAIVTAPVNKLALSMAGIDFPGHTEIFADRTGTRNFAMLMYSPKVAVALATCHQSLRSVPDSLTVDRLVEVGKLLDSYIVRLRGKRPRIAVLGLNPHAGESGLFGNEEARAVAPAVERLRGAGIDAEGPLPPDTAFTPAALGVYTAHLCLYHDQGLIPFKALAFDTGVNITMGIPFVRTSVDHGTAYDIAGKGLADDSSLREAVAAARELLAVRPR